MHTAFKRLAVWPTARLPALAARSGDAAHPCNLSASETVMGPLKGIKVIELQGIGPAPHCCMMLSDMGAEVIRVDRAVPGVKGVADPRYDVMARGRKSVAVNLKKPEGVETVLRLVEQADALIEGFRPGVMERLGLGPDVCMARNERLVYGRMTGWGQDGPISGIAGHDINYIALGGTLHHIGVAGGKPVPPLNLVGDFGGGGMLLAMGTLAALLEAKTSGKGQVIDAAMLEGATQLGAFLWGLRKGGSWKNARGSNILDTGSHFYNTYECKDGKYVSIGSIEPQFYAELLELTGTKNDEMPAQMDREQWPAMQEKFAAIFKTKTRDEWTEIMGMSDVCFAPVLDMQEAEQHPHNKARGMFVDVAGITMPAPAPRFSRTPSEIQGPPAQSGQHTDATLAAFGFSDDEISRLRASDAIA